MRCFTPVGPNKKAGHRPALVFLNLSCYFFINWFRAASALSAACSARRDELSALEADDWAALRLSEQDASVAFALSCAA